MMEKKRYNLFSKLLPKTRKTETKKHKKQRKNTPKKELKQNKRNLFAYNTVSWIFNKKI